MPANKIKKILLVFGTRPEAIKMAPLVKEFQHHPDLFETVVCVTAQHREMLDQVLQLFEITPEYDLNIMKAGQDLFDITSRVLLGMRDVLHESKPDIVLVHGDTSTSTAAALAAFYQQIPVGHVEAGLRTHNMYSPWPEEINRQVTSRMATFNFAPTIFSKQNLLKEGLKEESIFITGNTVIDALHWVINKFAKDPHVNHLITNQLIQAGLPADKLESWHYCISSQFVKSNLDQVTTVPSISESRKMILITGHRRENFGQGFLNICEAIKELAEKYPDVDFVYPMHLNPNVRNAIQQVFGVLSEIRNNLHDFYGQNVYFIEPLDYLPFVYLMNLSYIVLTDSGGIQEEAPGLGKPVLVMRDTTERPEALDAGTVKLVGTNKNLIIKEVSLLIESKENYLSMAKANNPYGDGRACERIINILEHV
jgi:UDP-N-acetylglucosamine 2-epimerase (non-hydrolysing)